MKSTSRSRFHCVQNKSNSKPRASPKKLVLKLKSKDNYKGLLADKQSSEGIKIRKKIVSDFNSDLITPKMIGKQRSQKLLLKSDKKEMSSINLPKYKISIKSP